MTTNSLPLAIQMRIRILDRPGPFNAFEYFTLHSSRCDLTLLEQRSTPRTLFYDTLKLAERIRGEESDVVFFEGFRIHGTGVPVRHFWIRVNGQHQSLTVENVPAASEFWGLGIPSKVLTYCTLSATISIEHGVLNVLSELPYEKIVTVAWFLSPPVDPNA